MYAPACAPQGLEKLLRGAREKKLLTDGHDTLPEFGACKATLGRVQLPRVLRLLIATRMLREDCLPSSHGGFSSRLSLGAEVGLPWGVRGVRQQQPQDSGASAAGSKPAEQPSFSVFDPPLAGSVVLKTRGALLPSLLPSGSASGSSRGSADPQRRGSGGGGDSAAEDEDEDSESEAAAEAEAGAAAAMMSGSCLPCGDDGPLPPCEMDREGFFSQSSQSVGAFER